MQLRNCIVKVRPSIETLLCVFTWLRCYISAVWKHFSECKLLEAFLLLIIRPINRCPTKLFACRRSLRARLPQCAAGGHFNWSHASRYISEWLRAGRCSRGLKGRKDMDSLYMFNRVCLFSCCVYLVVSEWDVCTSLISWLGITSRKQMPACAQ